VDVYVEKPACHNPFECQKMIEVTPSYNGMVQVGVAWANLVPLANAGYCLKHELKRVGNDAPANACIAGERGCEEPR